MAQEIFHYFGKDEFGTIGNDTTLATADMDGIMMICLQALEKRTTELKSKQNELSKAKEEISELKSTIYDIKTELNQMKNKLSILSMSISKLEEDKAIQTVIVKNGLND